MSARLMRRGLVAIVAVALAVALTACNAKKVVSAPTGGDVDVATPAMVAQKAKARVQDCPQAQLAHGTLPAVTLECLGGGRDVDLSTLKGPLLINIFQAGCAPCRLEMPALEAFHRAYPQVPVLGVDSNDYMAPLALTEAIQRGVTYPMIADPDGHLQGTSLSITGYPFTYFLRPDGRVVLLQTGGFHDEAAIVTAVERQLGHDL